MKKDILIRKAEIKDLESILKLNLDLFKKEYKEYDKSLNLNWTYNEGKRYFKNRITKKNGFVEVAEVNNEVVGYLCGGISKRLLSRRKANYAELENTIVKKSFRNKGIGEKLAKNFLAWCKKNKMDYISVTASAKNRHGINFYKKLGFKDHDLILQIETKSQK